MERIDAHQGRYIYCNRQTPRASHSRFPRSLALGLPSSVRPRTLLPLPLPSTRTRSPRGLGRSRRAGGLRLLATPFTGSRGLGTLFVLSVSSFLEGRDNVGAVVVVVVVAHAVGLTSEYCVAANSSDRRAHAGTGLHYRRVQVVCSGFCSLDAAGLEQVPGSVLGKGEKKTSETSGAGSLPKSGTEQVCKLEHELTRPLDESESSAGPPPAVTATAKARTWSSCIFMMG